MDAGSVQAVCSTSVAARLEPSHPGPSTGSETHPAGGTTSPGHAGPSAGSDTHPAGGKTSPGHAGPSTGSDTHPAARKTPSKRKRKPSGGGGRHHGHRPLHKKAKQDVSSTRAANNIMKFRLGGSVSDPLNLEGDLDLPDECSTCAPSPAPASNEELIPPPLLLTPQLSKDPLNLEGKVKNFPLLSKCPKFVVAQRC